MLRSESNENAAELDDAEEQVNEEQESEVELNEADSEVQGEADLDSAMEPVTRPLVQLSPRRLHRRHRAKKMNNIRVRVNVQV